MTVLYLHRRNDYFFKNGMADLQERRYAFLRAVMHQMQAFPASPHQTIGYADDLSVYDRGPAKTIKLIRSEARQRAARPHGKDSTERSGCDPVGAPPSGVLARRQPILNSAWLEMQSMASWREAMAPRHRGHIMTHGRGRSTGGASHYGRSLARRASSQIPEGSLVRRLSGGPSPGDAKSTVPRLVAGS